MPYLPAEYAIDGFVHCTAGDELMLAVANRFYKEVGGGFVLLSLDAELLDAPLRWEEGRPPEAIAAGETLAAQFPHLYGPINLEAVVAVRSAQRLSDGTFITWEPDDDKP